MAERPPRPPSTFRQRDVVAAIRAVEAAGHKVERVEIGKDGKISIITAQGQSERGINQWDEALS